MCSQPVGKFCIACKHHRWRKAGDSTYITCHHPSLVKHYKEAFILAVRVNDAAVGDMATEYQMRYPHRCGTERKWFELEKNIKGESNYIHTMKESTAKRVPY